MSAGVQDDILLLRRGALNEEDDKMKRKEKKNPPFEENELRSERWLEGESDPAAARNIIRQGFCLSVFLSVSRKLYKQRRIYQTESGNVIYHKLHKEGLR